MVKKTILKSLVLPKTEIRLVGKPTPSLIKVHQLTSDMILKKPILVNLWVPDPPMPSYIVYNEQEADFVISRPTRIRKYVYYFFQFFYLLNWYVTLWCHWKYHLKLFFVHILQWTITLSLKWFVLITILPLDDSV